MVLFVAAGMLAGEMAAIALGCLFGLALLFSVWGKFAARRPPKSVSYVVILVDFRRLHVRRRQTALFEEATLPYLQQGICRKAQRCDVTAKWFNWDLSSCSKNY